MVLASQGQLVQQHQLPQGSQHTGVVASLRTVCAGPLFQRGIHAGGGSAEQPYGTAVCRYYPGGPVEVESPIGASESEEYFGCSQRQVSLHH